MGIPNYENLGILNYRLQLYQYVEYENKNEQENRKNQLDYFYNQRIEDDLTEKASKLNLIINSDDFNNYNNLLQLIPNQLTENNKNKITEKIYKIIIQKCSDEFKPELWIKGIIEDIPYELILKYFLDKYTPLEKKLSILTKLQKDKRLEFLKIYSEKYTFEAGFVLIENFIIKDNSLKNIFKLYEVGLDSEFWKEKKGEALFVSFNDFINSQSNDEQKFNLYLKGYLKNISLNIVRQRIQQIDKEGCKKIFKNLSENKPFIKDILIEKVTLEDLNSLSWLYDLAIEFLDQEHFNLFDNKVFDTITQSEYFKYWEIGKAKIFPQHQIEELLNETFENYAQINKWINNNLTTIEEISELLFSFLHKQVLVTNRSIFYKQLNHIKYLLQLNELNFQHVKQIKNDFYDVILWTLDKEDVLNFELLRQKFIYFAPDEQVRILRKLFLLKANGQFDLTIEHLNKLTRFDLDLYETNLELNPEIPIDISTDVVVKALKSFKQNNRFFLENELFTIILTDLKYDKKRRFRLANYFENCLGRQTANFNFSCQGEISKVNFGINQFYFAISFSNLITNSPWGATFENLKEAVKKITGAKWNPEKKHWGVKSKYETEVLKFAKDQRFFLDFEGSKYENNVHLVKYHREVNLNGISFCEGRLANKPHIRFKKEFWWCGRQPCFSKCETIHKTDEWEKYTLLDFCEILDLNTDETNKMGDFIPKGKYYQFIALINRFNRLLEKLYCKDCGHILYPSDFGTSHFAANTIVRFQCRNDKCDNDKEIYLNHCLNGQCNNIIDSRISKQCENGLFICDSCGSCCSHNMLERRLSNLKLTGGKIHDNLVNCVENKLGHLERAEYFCFKCKSKMIEISNDFFKCLNCNVEYDTTKFKFKRPHRHFEKTGATSGNYGNDKEEFNNDSDFQF